jgi:hypothetical protein
MKPYDKVSSLWGANTLLQGQQNKNRKEKRTDHKSQINKADHQERSKKQIKGDQRTRAVEPGPLRDATSEGQSTL